MEATLTLPLLLEACLSEWRELKLLELFVRAWAKEAACERIEDPFKEPPFSLLEIISSNWEISPAIINPI